MHAHLSRNANLLRLTAITFFLAAPLAFAQTPTPAAPFALAQTAAPLAFAQTPTPAAPFALAQTAAPLALPQIPAPAAPAPDPCASVPQAAFDVATVKPTNRSSGDTDISGHPDSITVDASAFRMILFAYKLHDFQLIGGPGWLATSTWEATAKADQPPAGYSSLSNDARDAIARQRIQAVLAQRFALKCHFETRQLPVYNLVLAKGGPKLQPASADEKNVGSIHGSGSHGAHRINGTGISMEFIAAILAQNIGRTVLDKTGLTGLYDFTLTYASDADAASTPAADDSASGPTLFTALEEQLGLKLEPAKGPVPILVIDSIDRPSEN